MCGNIPFSLNNIAKDAKSQNQSPFEIFNAILIYTENSIFLLLLQHSSESHTGKTDVTAPVSCVFSM